MGFQEASPENVGAGDDEEAALPNPKEEDGAKAKPEELEEVEAAVNESTAVEVAVGVEFALLMENGEPLEKENPIEAEKGEVAAKFEAELDESKPVSDGIVTVVAADAEDEDAKPKGLVVAAAGAGEDETIEEPLLAPNKGEDVPNPSENYKLKERKKKTKSKILLV